MPSNTEIYERVTNTIIDALERGVVPWKRPWSSTAAGFSTLHQNMVTKRPYRGVNQFLCEIVAATNGYSTPLWLSKKQINQKGGKIRKGEKGTMIVFWKILKFTTDEIDERTGKPIMKTVPLLKFYYIWNVEQCDGVKIPDFPETPEDKFTPIERAQQVIDNMPNRPETFHRGDRAFYHPSADQVTLPPQVSFKTPEDYYTTAYHEYAHSTGHEDRTGRVTDWTAFGSDPYAREELVAELTAAMLCGTVGITVTQDQSASYIDNWIRVLKGDKKLIVGASGKAQKAADYILAKDGNGEAEAEAIAEKELTNV